MDRKSKAFLIAGTVFSISTTVAQVISINTGFSVFGFWNVSAEALKFLLFGINFAAWINVLLAIYIIRTNRISQLHANTLIDMLPEGEVVYKSVENEIELELVWHLDQSAYGDQNISKERLQSWWNQNNKGLFIRTKGGAIEASFGLWPITKEAFLEIIRGRKSDVQMSTVDLVRHDLEFNSSYWYLSGLLTKTSEDILYEFVANAFQNFLQRLNPDLASINIVFMPLTAPETSILKPLGFSKVNQNGKLSIWVYTKTNLSHIQTIPNTLLRSGSSIDIYEDNEGIE